MTMMKTCVWLMVVLVGCGDDGGSTTGDAKGSDAGGSGSDAGAIDMATGPQGSTQFATPTDIAVGVTGSGTLTAFNPQTLEPQHFWRFTPPTTGNYTITLTGPANMSVNWCGNSGSQQGCGCFLNPSPPDPCCTVATGNCTAVTLGATAADDGILVVFNGSDTQGSYTLTLTAP
jgi:hypothetical protein